MLPSQYASTLAQEQKLIKGVREHEIQSFSATFKHIFINYTDKHVYFRKCLTSVMYQMYKPKIFPTLSLELTDPFELAVRRHTKLERQQIPVSVDEFFVSMFAELFIQRQAIHFCNDTVISRYNSSSYGIEEELKELIYFRTITEDDRVANQLHMMNQLLFSSDQT